MARLACVAGVWPVYSYRYYEITLRMRDLQPDQGHSVVWRLRVQMHSVGGVSREESDCWIERPFSEQRGPGGEEPRAPNTEHHFEVLDLSIGLISSATWQAHTCWGLMVWTSMLMPVLTPLEVRSVAV